MNKPVYLDYNATGVVRPEVAEALGAYLRGRYNLWHRLC